MLFVFKILFVALASWSVIYSMLFYWMGVDNFPSILIAGTIGWIMAIIYGAVTTPKEG